MRIARVVWAVVVELIELAIIYAVLQAGTQRFERLALAGIVLTFLVVRAGASSSALALAETGLRSSRQFHAVAKLLNSPALQDYAESLEEAEHQFKGLQRRWLIYMGAWFVAWFMALWFLLRALR
jgi:hypothetical protein